MSTRVDGCEVRCKRCTFSKYLSYRGYYHQHEHLTSQEADAAVLEKARIIAKAHAREEHRIELSQIPFVRKVFPHGAWEPNSAVYVKQYGRQVG